MIVLRRSDGLVLIDQLDHAALAGIFAGHWGNDDFAAPEPLEAVVLAASRHDEGWRDWDESVRYDAVTQRPLYFLDVAIEDYVELYARGIERIVSIDRYAGLLVSMHGTGNVCGRWGIQRGIRLSKYDGSSWPEVITRYVLDEERRQARLKLALVGLDPVERRSRFERRLWSNYELMQAWDRLSLFLCRTAPGEHLEADLGVVPTSLEGGEAESLSVTALGDALAVVDPWPFGVDAIEASIPVREIRDREYECAEEAHDEVSRAPRGELTWTLAPADSTEQSRQAERIGHGQAPDRVRP